MNRPTTAEIRRLLNALGDDQVDPSSWFRGTLNEILRPSVELGRISTRIRRSTYDNLTLTSPATTETVFALSTAEPEETRIISNFFVRFGTANVVEITLELNQGGLTRSIWNDSTGPFPVGVYIGGDDDRTTRFAAQTGQKIKLIGSDMPGVTADQILQLRIRSAAAVVKTTFVDFRTDSYFSEDFPGW